MYDNFKLSFVDYRDAQVRKAKVLEAQQILFDAGYRWVDDSNRVISDASIRWLFVHNKKMTYGTSDIPDMKSYEEAYLGRTLELLNAKELLDGNV